MPMPIHDWTRVDFGVWHDFLLRWIVKLQLELNTELLPSTYYSLAENVTEPTFGLVSLNEPEAYSAMQRQISIRSVDNDALISTIQFVSPWDKLTSEAVRRIVDSAIKSLRDGHHLQIVDLFPCNVHDPDGMHSAIWNELGQSDEKSSLKQPSIVAYSNGETISAYVDPVEVGKALPDMPLFLSEDKYVSVPLNSTYRHSYNGVVGKFRRVVLV